MMRQLTSREGRHRKATSLAKHYVPSHGTSQEISFCFAALHSVTSETVQAARAGFMSIKMNQCFCELILVLQHYLFSNTPPTPGKSARGMRGGCRYV